MLLNEKHVVVLTYDRPHRKSEDIALRLYQAGFRNVDVIAQHWVDRSQMQMLAPQRPGDLGWPAPPLSVDPQHFFETFGWRYTSCDREDLHEHLANMRPDCVVVAGAGILSPEVTENFTVLNTHPGYLPFTRGLDTIKWGILYDLPIGVTTHILDSRTDAGRRIHQVRCPLKSTDDFTKFALRLYELELQMLVPALFVVLASNNKEDFPEIDVTEFASYRRMGKKKEREMLDKFTIAVDLSDHQQPGDSFMKFVLPASPWRGF